VAITAFFRHKKVERQKGLRIRPFLPHKKVPSCRLDAKDRGAYGFAASESTGKFRHRENFMGTKWAMRGTLLGACSCDWGCPCSFDAPPTKGFCDGAYLWHVDKGKFGDVSLDGLSFAWVGHSPGPLHEGNVTWLVLADEKANAAQRRALETLGEGKSGGPWVIFMAVASRCEGPRYVPFELQLDGLKSKARAGGIVEYDLGPILNPVTHEPEEIYVDKPTGFTSKRLTMGASRVFRVNSDVLRYDHSGKYAEFSHFDYSGEAHA